jgi:CMP/dCMP kinase
MKYNRITISGQICTGKTTLYKALEKKLSWKTYSAGQLFREYAKEHNLDIERGEEQNQQLTKKIDYQIRERLKKEKQIIVEGWMAGIMADDFPNVLKILLICHSEERVKRFASREEVNHSEASKRVVSRDTSWLREIENIYKRKDIFNPAHYDLVIDTTELSPEQILNKVLEKLED